MGSYIPPEGEVFEFVAGGMDSLQRQFSELRSRTSYGTGTEIYRPLKVQSGAVWWVCSDGPKNIRAQTWMDISEQVFGPVAYMSPREVQDFGSKDWMFDGEPMVELRGIVFPVREKIRKLGGIRHATNGKWWIPKPNAILAAEIIRKGG